jgi:pimeloyl-CoA synthetase
MVVGLKNEKESFVLKLNNLSSQNIDLINSCEKLEESLKRFEPKNLHHNGSKKEFTSAEIIDKNEIIRELSLKIEEMRSHENKLMQIIQKLNVDGVELQKIYSQTPVKQNLFTIKKRKRVQVPEIDLTKLPVD